MTIAEKTEDLFDISELLYKLKMYQEDEIPKRGKHSTSQDLIVLSFLFLVVFFFSFYCYQFAEASFFMHFQRWDRIHIFRIHV